MRDILVDIRGEKDSLKKEFHNKDLVSVQELVNLIYDLKYEVEETKEYYEDKIKRREEFIKDNYKQITPSEMWGGVN